MARFYEDFEVGDVEEFGTYDVTESEILEFAERYDPQWFHTDVERAEAESIYDGLIASGWHTSSMTMRLLVDNFLDETAALGAKGVDRLRWWNPVRPGDELSVGIEVVDKHVETPSRGLVEWEVVATNQEDTRVMSYVALVMVRRRDDTPES